MIGFGLLATVAFAYLMAKGHGNNFFFDEWTWIETRDNGLHAILASYNQHLLAVPIAVYQILFHTVGLGHYWVYRALEAAGHVGCVACVFVFARRRVGPAALLITAPLLVLGISWEYLLLAISFGFVTSIALSIAALIALERADRKGDICACALLVIALACSEFTVVFALGVAVELLWRQRRLSHVWIWAIPLALYALWWLGYHEPSMWSSNLTAAPGYAAEVAASAAGALFGLSVDWGRPLLVAGLVLLGWRLRDPRALTPRLAALLVAVGLYWLLVGLGRAQLGLPVAGRYIYAGAVLIVLIAAELARGVRPGWRSLAVGMVVALFAIAGNIRMLSAGEGSLRQASNAISAELGALELARSTAPAGLVLDQHYAPQLVAGPYFTATRSLGSSPADTPPQIMHRPASARVAADGVLERALAIQIGRGAQPASAAAAAPTVQTVALGTAEKQGKCINFRPQGSGAGLDLILPPGGLQLKATAGGVAAVRVRRFAASFGGAPFVSLTGGEIVVIRAAADRSKLPWLVRISSLQPVLACGL